MQRTDGISNNVVVAVFGIIVIIVAGAAVLGYNFASSNQQQQSNGAFQNQINSLQSEITSQSASVNALLNKSNSLSQIENQPPQVRNFKVEWANVLNTKQDRFFVPTIIVNQGDTVSITFVSNDTDAHTFTLESPYDFQINATVPGTLDYLKNETVFNTNATDNSPGVHVNGTPGNVTGTGSFVAKYSGIFEYFCIYHVQLGMFGYMVVLPNQAYSNASTTTAATGSSSLSRVTIRIGSGADTNSSGFTPATISVVLGINNTVVWSNNDTVPHTVTANDGTFSSGNMNPGDTFSWTFSNPGNYSYHCSYHPWMKGVIVVKSR